LTILSELVDVVIGVDTHKHTHTAVPVTAVGVALEAIELAAEPSGFDQILGVAVAAGRRRAWAIEGCGSWGRGLARWLAARGEWIIEAEQPARPKRRMGRKNDVIDAERAAREALRSEVHAQPKADGARDVIAAAQLARDSAVQAATDAERQLLALANTSPEPIAEQLRSMSTSHTVRACANWNPAQFTNPTTAAIATTMRSLAHRVIALRQEAAEHYELLNTHVTQWRPDLLEQTGIGPVVAATVLLAWSHPGRVRSAAAFCMLAGTAPIPASSGQTNRYRINRHGDRQLNRAINTIAITRLRCHPPSKAYAARRTSEGKSQRDIRRCLKNYIARDLYQLLETPIDRT
jgi:transposase